MFFKTCTVILMITLLSITSTNNGNISAKFTSVVLYDLFISSIYRLKDNNDFFLLFREKPRIK